MTGILATVWDGSGEKEDLWEETGLGLWEAQQVGGGCHVP